MAFYCSNYYGSIQCQTTVARFGDRCKLCTVMRVGASITDGLLPEDLPCASSPDTPKSAEHDTLRRGRGRVGPQGVQTK